MEIKTRYLIYAAVVLAASQIIFVKSQIPCETLKENWEAPFALNEETTDAILYSMPIPDNARLLNPTGKLSVDFVVEGTISEVVNFYQEELFISGYKNVLIDEAIDDSAFYMAFEGTISDVLLIVQGVKLDTKNILVSILYRIPKNVFEKH